MLGDILGQDWSECAISQLFVEKKVAGICFTKGGRGVPTALGVWKMPMDAEIEDITDVIEPSDYFGTLEDLLDRHKGDVEGLLATVMTFVDKRTDFFLGGDPRHKVVFAMRRAGVKAKPKSATSAKASSKVGEEVVNGYLGGPAYVWNGFIIR